MGCYPNNNFQAIGIGLTKEMAIAAVANSLSVKIIEVSSDLYFIADYHYMTAHTCVSVCEANNFIYTGVFNGYI